MTAYELFDHFRSNTRDVSPAYFWTDEEVWMYMNAAYRMFVRLTGGIADFTSEATEVSIVSGVAEAELHPSILRIMSAYRRSDEVEIEIINPTDLGRIRSSDYGQIKQIYLDTTSGPVRYMLLGGQKNLVRWVQVPAADDTADLMIYRLPLEQITCGEQELTEVEEDHHLYLYDWMEHLAYLKKDADTFDPNGAALAEARFRKYCAEVKAEWERYKHKHREVAYGGI